MPPHKAHGRSADPPSCVGSLGASPSSAPHASQQPNFLAYHQIHKHCYFLPVSFRNKGSFLGGKLSILLFAFIKMNIYHFYPKKKNKDFHKGKSFLDSTLDM